MSVYTRGGDKGTSALANGARLPKYDIRFETLGTIDEMTSQIGLARAADANGLFTQTFLRVQNLLITLMAGLAAPNESAYRLNADEVAFLEAEIDRLEASFPRHKGFVLPGDSELGARLDVARTVARRAERRMAEVKAKLPPVDPVAQAYLNRLADYLYIAARYADHVASGQAADQTIDPEEVVRITQAVLNRLEPSTPDQK